MFLAPTPFSGMAYRHRSRQEIEADIQQVESEKEALFDQAQSILDRSEAENRELTKAEMREFDDIIGGRNSPPSKLDRVAEKTKALQDELQAAEADQKNRENVALNLARGKEMTVSIQGNGNTPASQQPNLKVSRLKAFDNDQDAVDSAMWFTALSARRGGSPNEKAENHIANRGIEIFAAATEGSPSGGGYVVPTPLHNAILNVQEKAGVSRQICRVQAMTSDTLSIAKKTAGTTVYYPGEAGEISQSTQTYNQLTLNAKKRAVLSLVSNELVQDAVINFIDDLAVEMGNDFAVKQDDELFNGNGSSSYGGVVGLKTSLGSAGVATAESGEDTWAELDLEDHTAAMGLLDSRYMDKAVWACSSQYYHDVMLRILSEAGGNTVRSLQDGDGTGRPKFLGADVFLTSKMPTATAASTVAALFGSFQDAVVIGSRLQVEIAFSDQRYFEYDQTAVRGVSRYDINVHEAGDSSNVGAYTGVSTNS